MGFRHGKWKFDGIPKFSGSREAAEYFAKEENKWEHGYDGLSGSFYKYLTVYTIKDRVTGQILLPDLRPPDMEQIFPWMEDVQSKKSDGLWVTQRGAGKSTILNGFLPLETAINFPGSKTIMTSDAVQTTKMNVADKLKISYDGMNEFYRPSIIGVWPSQKDEHQFVQFGKKVKGKNDAGLGSTIQAIETAHTPKSPAKLEGFGTKALVIDEPFKHPYVEDIRSKAAPLVKRGMKKEGSIWYVGSCSDASAKGLNTMIDLWNNAKTYGITPLFVSADWFNPFIPQYTDSGELMTGNKAYVDVRDKNGYVDRKLARTAILKARAVLERLPNKKSFLEFTMMYPLDIEDIINVTKENWWNPEDILLYKEQSKVVSVAHRSTSPNKWDNVDRPATLYENNAGQIAVDYNATRDNASYFIFNEPEVGRHYISGTDAIPFSSENKVGSDFVTTVKCIETNQYVGALVERSYDAMLVGKHAIWLQRYYAEGAQLAVVPNLVERNSIGALKLVYEQMGYKKWLANCPHRFRPKSAKVEIGLNKDSNATEIHQLVRDYVVKNMHLMYFLRFFEEFLGFPFANSDFMSAMAMTEALHEEWRMMSKRNEKDRPMPRATITYRTDQSGKRVMVSNYKTNYKPDGTLDIKHLFK